MGEFLATHPSILRLCVWGTYCLAMLFVWLFASSVVHHFGAWVAVPIVAGAIGIAYVTER